jgi:hypothetical protein
MSPRSGFIIITSTLTISRNYDYASFGTDPQFSITTRNAPTRDQPIPDEPYHTSHARDDSEQSDI